MKELKGLQDSVKEIEKLFTDYEDMLLLIEMSAGEDEEQEAAEEIEEELGTFEEVFEKLRISTLLIGPYDADNAIVTLRRCGRYRGNGLDKYALSYVQPLG